MPTKTKERSTKATSKKVSAKKAAAATPVKKVIRNGSSPSSPETLHRLYAGLLRCRLAQESKLLSGHYELAIGHEAVVVGPTADLTAEDTIVAAPSNLTALAARGLPFEALAGEMGCVARSSLTRASLPADPFHLATGIALAQKLAKGHHVVVAFCPQASPALETWHEALMFAGVHKLPVLFVITDGVADQKTSSEHAPHLEDFSFMARDYGYPGIIVDGQDVVGVFRVAQESIHRARQGSGPTLIDCRTDATRDPLEHMEHYMRKRKMWDDAWKRKVEAEMREEIQQAALLNP
jgi:acetoin:2,6-dichlorophenolindophenol oxidoreductase subunit alpha